MNLYEVALPAFDNNAKSYGTAVEAWARRALKKAGGYTEMGTRGGVWRDPADGTVYRETMYWFSVACAPDVMGQLMQEAFSLFPDQKAIFLAKVGTAEIVERPVCSHCGRQAADNSACGIGGCPLGNDL